MQTAVLKRASIVIAILWVVFTGLYAFFEADKIASEHVDLYQSFCKDDPNKYPECKKSQNDLYYESWQESGIWIVLADIFGPIVFVFVIWLICYTATRIFFWIRTGEFQSQTNLAKKYSLFATLGFLLFLGIWVASVSIHDRSIKRSLSNCKIEALKSNIEISNNEGKRYLEACMISRGFELQDWTWCYDSTEYVGCYK